MIMFKRIMLVAMVAGTCWLGQQAQAALILSYGSSAGSSQAPSFVDSRISATNIVRGPGVSSNSGGSFNSRDWEEGSNLNGAIANDNYLGWTITVGAGQQLDLTTMDVRLDRSNTGPPNFAVGYMNGSTFNSLFTNTIGASGTEHSNQDLSAAPTFAPGDTIMMRLYAWGASSSSGTMDPETTSSFGGNAIRISGDFSSASSNTDYTTFAVTPNTAPNLGGSASIAQGEGSTTSINTSWSQNNISGPVLNASPTASGLPLQIISDTLTLTGLQNGTDVFTLSMNYNDLFFINQGFSEAQAAADDLIFLAVWNGSQWVNATDENVGGDGIAAELAVASSWTDFALSRGINNGNVADWLGSWGYDINTNEVWAVIDHNSDFAVVPEPASATLMLLGVGAMLRRRR